ncbi:MAG: ATP-binding protein [Patescibacteria group bacterium]
MQKIVITGGPSIGKTTLVEILASRGYAVVPEAARIIIEEEKLKVSGVLPTGEFAKFQELVFKRQLELEAGASGDVVFFDRGIVDGIGYCKCYGLPLPEGLDAAAKTNRYDKVFILDPVGKYEADGVRFSGAEKDKDVHPFIEAAYREYGYYPTVVPALTPDDRVDFILANI